KTPLTTVKAYIEAILAGVCGDREAILAYVEVMQTHTDKMARQVEDLLLHALQELGQLPVTPREQYSGQALRRMLEPLCHAIRTRGVVCVEPAAIPDVLLALDAVRIEQVLTNLVYNALKHTATGDTIRLEVAQEPGQLRLLVSDTGTGVLPQDMPFLFDRYYRGHATSAADGSQPEGTGLGLSICKHIVEAHGGTIGFRSRPGEGTVFHFTLPLS
ncbi:putative two-component sensor histidine kinase, partial [Paenibacillus sp. 598K]|uniref:sensor histidine kinase n=1 Tax=Paenibacillus sp. 598K TaxID=1117987 RepID=UPI000FFAC864